MCFILPCTLPLANRTTGEINEPELNKNFFPVQSPSPCSPHTPIIVTTTVITIVIPCHECGIGHSIGSTVEKSWIIICISTSGEGLFAGYSQFIYPWNRYFHLLCGR